MNTARVCFLWPRHQPYDTDPVAGFADLAWLRLHAPGTVLRRLS